MDPNSEKSVSLDENLKKAVTEVLLLHLLSDKDRYIGELTSIIREKSNGRLNIVFPYSAIYRLQQSGYLTESEKRLAPDGRRRQYYRITKAGRDYLHQLMEIYRSFSQDVADVLAEGETKDE